MAGRFSTRRATPDFPPSASAPLAVPAAVAPSPPPPDEAVAWTVFPQSEAAPDPIVPMMLAPQPAALPAQAGAPASSPLLTDKLLDAKVRLHRKLIEEINLSAREKLPEEEIRK